MSLGYPLSVFDKNSTLTTFLAPLFTLSGKVREGGRGRERDRAREYVGERGDVANKKERQRERRRERDRRETREEGRGDGQGG